MAYAAEEPEAPAHYDFAYAVNEPATGDQKDQHETRDGDQVSGYYRTLDSDGYLRTVNYKSDAVNGFTAEVVREPVSGSAALAPVPTAKVVAKVPVVKPVAPPVVSPLRVTPFVAPSAPIPYASPYYYGSGPSAYPYYGYQPYPYAYSSYPYTYNRQYPFFGQYPASASAAFLK